MGPIDGKTIINRIRLALMVLAAILALGSKFWFPADTKQIVAFFFNISQRHFIWSGLFLVRFVLSRAVHPKISLSWKRFSNCAYNLIWAFTFCRDIWFCAQVTPFGFVIYPAILSLYAVAAVWDILFDLRFKWNARQCADVDARVNANATTVRQLARDAERWRRIQQMCKPAVTEFNAATEDANRFLQDCSSEADFWAQSLNSIIKHDTREAYDVLIHNLIWSKAGLDVAILFNSEAGDVNYTQIIMKKVRQCTSLLSYYDREATQPQLNGDREELYRIAANHKWGQAEKNCLNFLVNKSQAYQELSQIMYGSGGASTCRLQRALAKFQIDPRDLPKGGEGELLGQGSYGKVYRAVCHGRPVAVKVFKGLHQEDESFEREAAVLASLRSPFIVEMVGWCKEDGDCMLVMELTGTDLQNVIDSRSPLSMHAAVDIMLQIAKGMEYLHERGVIHRDIKPGNVLLEPSTPVEGMTAQGYARVKLSDFGLAKVKQASAEDRSRYTTLRVGTSHYRSPETLLTEDEPPAKYTRKADVYSYGITCSEILGGESATSCYYVGKKPEVQMKIRQNVRPSLPSDCPSHLKDLITKCWDADPECRPPFSKISRQLTYIKFIMTRVSDMRLYGSVVTPFDVEELERRNRDDFDREELERRNRDD